MRYDASLCYTSNSNEASFAHLYSYRFYPWMHASLVVYMRVEDQGAEGAHEG